MLQSKLFTKTKKESPSDETAKNAKLLIRAGFIHKEMAGVYSYLPLGFRVLEKIKNIIREEMNAIGGEELLLTTLQDKVLWEKSGRWNDEVVDNWFKTRLHDGKNFHKGSELGIANTHEEPLTNIVKDHISSYKDLPKYLYQIQTKFRNELRVKSGLMRCREFIMKDLYSFDIDETASKEFYEICASAYMKIFNRVGIGEKTYRTIAGGGSFTSGFTDEFQTVCSAGEDIIYIDEEKKLALNKEVYNDDIIKKFNLNKAKMRQEKAIEVGNIFPLGTKYAEALGLYYTDERGERKPPIMGSYGIGLGRLMATIVEIFSDDKGICWPESVAPFRIHLIALTNKNDAVISAARSLYDTLIKRGLEVLYDDRELSAGEKFADADLIGIPFRLIVSEKTLAEDSVEVKKRNENTARLVKLSQIENFFGR